MSVPGKDRRSHARRSRLQPLPNQHVTTASGQLGSHPTLQAGDPAVQTVSIPGRLNDSLGAIPSGPSLKIEDLCHNAPSGTSTLVGEREESDELDRILEEYKMKQAQSGKVSE